MNKVILNLHSIMYLLIHMRKLIDVSSYKFTFHNVSINSRLWWRIDFVKIGFTFHNVSINSSNRVAYREIAVNLHSIMYLLIRANGALRAHLTRFTFHNVSINSQDAKEKK